MKTLIVLIFALPALAFGQVLKLKKLTLKNGREYEKVTVTEKRPDGISISHESGTARIKFEDLPADVAKQFGGFDSEAAAKARAEVDAKEAATLAEINKGVAAQGAQKSVVDSHKAATAAARPVMLKIVQIYHGGALCYVATKNSNPTLPRFSRYSESVSYVTGISGLVDGVEVGAMIVDDGTYEYTLVEGAKSTVEKLKAIPESVRTDVAPNLPPVRRPVSSSQSVGGG